MLFGAAITGIGLPLAAVGVGIAIATQIMARRKAKAQFSSLVEGYLSEMREVFIREVLEPHVFPALREANKRLADEYVERLALGLDEYFPPSKLDETLKVLRVSLVRLDNHALSNRGAH